MIIIVKKTKKIIKNKITVVKKTGRKILKIPYRNNFNREFYLQVIRYSTLKKFLYLELEHFFGKLDRTGNKLIKEM